jgi:hypothetical protein
MNPNSVHIAAAERIERSDWVWTIPDLPSRLRLGLSAFGVSGRQAIA